VGSRLPIRRAAIRSGCSVTRHVFHASSPLASQWLVRRQIPSSAERLSRTNTTTSHYSYGDLDPEDDVSLSLSIASKAHSQSIDVVNRKCGEFLLGGSCNASVLRRHATFCRNIASSTRNGAYNATFICYGLAAFASKRATSSSEDRSVYNRRRRHQCRNPVATPAASSTPRPLRPAKPMTLSGNDLGCYRPPASSAMHVAQPACGRVGHRSRLVATGQADARAGSPGSSRRGSESDVTA
jgi:hypothetical protein